MSHAERDLTTLLDHVARAQHARALASLSAEERAQAPTYDQVPAVGITSFKQHLLPLVMDVLAALDEQDRLAAENDLLAGLEAQFADPEAPTEG